MEVSFNISALFFLNSSFMSPKDRLFRPVYFDPSFWTCLFELVFLDSSLWSRLFGRLGSHASKKFGGS